MPEFILDYGSPDAAHQFAALDEFTQGYIEALFFTNTGTGDDAELENATVADLSPEAWARIVADCAAFQANNKALLDAAYAREYTPEQAGRDFWFTRNGHGVGFWDRDALEPDSAEYESLTAEMVAHRNDRAKWGAACAKRNALKSESLGERLSAACRHRDVTVYAGDDGKVYLA